MIIEKNNEEIIRKNTLIAELKARQSRSCSMEDKQYILQKMLDMQNKTKTLMKHLAGNKHLELKLDHLKEKVISMFGHKLTGLTLKVQKFIG